MDGEPDGICGPKSVFDILEFSFRSESVGFLTSPPNEGVKFWILDWLFEILIGSLVLQVVG